MSRDRRDQCEDERQDEGEEFREEFLDGNERIEQAISTLYEDKSNEKITAVLSEIQQRMHEEGHFILPLHEDEKQTLSFHEIQLENGETWVAAFTSFEEFEKGDISRALSHSIDATLKAFADMDTAGIVLNPWGQSFWLPRDLMRIIIDADEGVEYLVPDDTITKELLEDGSFLKRAIEICHRNPTQMNKIRLYRILRDSQIWIPCVDKGEVLSPVIIDIEGDYYMPAFTSMDELKEAFEEDEAVKQSFMEVMELAENVEPEVCGVVLNKYNLVPITKDEFSIIRGMDSKLLERGE